MIQSSMKAIRIAAVVVVLGLMFGMAYYKYSGTKYRNLTDKQVQAMLAMYGGLNDNSNPDTLKLRSRDLGMSPRVVGRYHGRLVEEAVVCFGDLCPQSGGYFLRYQGSISRDECVSMGGNPIVGIGWSEVYAGCGAKI